jgi:hypothetical protein
MRFGRIDPGECPICGAPHCSCGGAGVEVVQLPNRDAAAALERAAPAPELVVVPLVAEVVQATLPAGQFTSATYRGNRKARGPLK